MTSTIEHDQMTDGKSCKSDNDVDRDEFYERLHKLLLSKTAPNSFVLSVAKYDRILQQVKDAKTKLKKEPADYRRIKRYEIIKTPQGERLIMAPTDSNKPPQIFVSVEEIYDIIRDHHLKMNHAGRSKLMQVIKPKFKNITTELVLLYLSLCQGCKSKSIKRSRIVHKSQDGEKFNSDLTHLENVSFEMEVDRDDPLQSEPSDDLSDLIIENNIVEEGKVFPELFSRGQIDFLSVSLANGDCYKYLMVYRNFVTKFIHLKPLKTINVEESVDILMDIFLVFGAPNVLMSKNGTSVTKQICRRIYSVFPDFKVVSGVVRKNVQGVFKGHSNEEILKLLRDWCKENKDLKWYQGIKFVQYMLNNSFNTDICRTPSESVFGCKPTRGLTSFMQKNEYDHLVTESDLKNALEEKDSGKNLEQLLLDETLIPSDSIIKLERNDTDGSDCDD